MKKFKMFVGIALIFFLGGLIGAIGSGLFARHKIENFRKGGPPPVKHIMLKRLSHKLELNESQKKEVDKIVDELQAELHTIMKKHHPEVQSLFEKYFTHIEDKLDQGQRAEFERIKREFYHRRQSRLEKKHRPGAKHFNNPLSPGFKGKDGAWIGKKFLKRFSRKLNLSENQQEEIEKIIDHNFKQIKHTLSAEQKEKFEQMQR